MNCCCCFLAAVPSTVAEAGTHHSSSAALGCAPRDAKKQVSLAAALPAAAQSTARRTHTAKSRLDVHRERDSTYRPLHPATLLPFVILSPDGKLPLAPVNLSALYVTSPSLPPTSPPPGPSVVSMALSSPNINMTANDALLSRWTACTIVRRSQIPSPSPPYNPAGRLHFPTASTIRGKRAPWISSRRKLACTMAPASSTRAPLRTTK